MTAQKASSPPVVALARSLVALFGVESGRVTIVVSHPGQVAYVEVAHRVKVDELERFVGVVP